MMIRVLRPIAAAALLLSTALPAWAQQADAATPPLAVQMYTLRNIEPLEERIRIVHDAGIRAVETVGTQDLSAPELKQLLDRYSIRPISAHVALSTLRQDLDGAADVYTALGNPVLVVPWLAETERPADADGWRALGAELGGYAAQLAERGMRLAYHNHEFELAEFDGKTALDLMFEAAGPALLLELDLAWAARADHDPAALLEQYRGRVFAVHAKDNTAPGQGTEEGGFAAPGQGVLDWDTILPAAARAGTQWYIIEHDQPLDPAAVVQAGATFLGERLAPGASR